MHKVLLLSLLFTNICLAGNSVSAAERRLMQALFSVLPVVAEQSFFVLYRTPAPAKIFATPLKLTTAKKIKKQTHVDKRFHGGRQNYTQGKSRH